MPQSHRRALLGLVILLGFSISSCEPKGSPVSPSPSPTPGPPAPPPPLASSTLTGSVVDYSSGEPRAVPGVLLFVHFDTLGAPPRQVTSDASGHFSVPDVPNGPLSIAPAPGSGYFAPCPAGATTIGYRWDYDVAVVSASAIAVAGVTNLMPHEGGLWVSGIVFEMSSQGRRPVAGAEMTMEVDGQDAHYSSFSRTLTDLGGHYLLCPPIPGTGSDILVDIVARRDGYGPRVAQALLGWSYDGVDIELVRQ